MDINENGTLSKEVKAFEIEEALQKNDRLTLKTLACTAGGFMRNKLRIKVWSNLADIDSSDNHHFQIVPNEIIQQNQNYRQVILDVERSLKRFPPSVKEAQRIAYQDSLTNVIIMILDKNPSFYYYQGYHDVCLTFLLIMEEERALKLINRISQTHLNFFMEKTMNTTSNLLQIIYLILKDDDPELHDYLLKSEVGTIFSLSWVITWFSHVLSDLDQILRLFDFFISTHYLMPIYMTVSILLYKREKILKIDCDMASMHKYLTSITQEENLPIDKLVLDTLLLSVAHPPEDTLERQRQIEWQALRDDENDSLTLLYKSGQFLRRNILPLSFLAAFTAIIIQYRHSS